MRIQDRGLVVVLLALSACSDDGVAGASGTDDGTTTRSETTTSPEASDTVTPGESSGSSADATGTSSNGDSSGSGTGTRSDGSTGTGSDGSSGSESSSGSGSGSSSSTGSDTGEELACDSGGGLVFSGSVSVPGGSPFDLPADLTESCTMTDNTPPQITVECESLTFGFEADTTPAIDLPDAPQNVDVRLHSQAGPFGFPEVWLQIDFQDGVRLAYQASSVLEPNNDTVELPLGMQLTDDTCGPYNVPGPFGMKDNCGDQEWFGLSVQLESEDLTVLHGTYGTLTDGFTTELWVQTARDYGTVPQFCDIPARFFSYLLLSQP